MQCRVVFFAVLHRLHKGFVFKETAVPHRLGNPGELLIHHAAGADIGMSDLAVAHLPVRQADVHARRADAGGRIFRKEPV